jgi:hypothetical protein
MLKTPPQISAQRDISESYPRQQSFGLSIEVCAAAA